jgi:predicted Zn-dependent protease
VEVKAVNKVSRRHGRRVYRLKGDRFVRLVVVLLLCVASLSSLAMVAVPHLRPLATTQRLLEVTVDTGDTLWGLAARYSPSTRDIRHTVNDILQINSLATAELQPGQVILVPGK